MIKNSESVIIRLLLGLFIVLIFSSCKMFQEGMERIVILKKNTESDYSYYLRFTVDKNSLSEDYRSFKKGVICDELISLESYFCGTMKQYNVSEIVVENRWQYETLLSLGSVLKGQDISSIFDIVVRVEKNPYDKSCMRFDKRKKEFPLGLPYAMSIKDDKGMVAKFIFENVKLELDKNREDYDVYRQLSEGGIVDISSILKLFRVEDGQVYTLFLSLEDGWIEYSNHNVKQQNYFSDLLTTEHLPFWGFFDDGDSSHYSNFVVLSPEGSLCALYFRHKRSKEKSLLIEVVDKDYFNFFTEKIILSCLKGTVAIRSHKEECRDEFIQKIEWIEHLNSQKETQYTFLPISDYDLNNGLPHFIKYH